MLMQATDMTVKYGLKTILNHVDFYINEKESHLSNYWEELTREKYFVKSYCLDG